MLPDVLRLIANRYDPAVPPYLRSPMFWVGFLFLVALGGGVAVVLGATGAIEALAYGFAAPELVSKLSSAVVTQADAKTQKRIQQQSDQDWKLRAEAERLERLALMAKEEAERREALKAQDDRGLGSDPSQGGMAQEARDKAERLAQEARTAREKAQQASEEYRRLILEWREGRWETILELLRWWAK
jgi:hypothetical protein